MTNLPKSRQSDIVVQEFENEILVYDLKTNKAFCLNETSAIIYQFCNGKNSVADISNLISKELNQTITEDFVWLALSDFKRDNLLENNDQLESSFNGLNRRQIIKKIGFASMVMLPVVSSIVSPTAANAASLAPLRASCSSPSQCASNNCTNLGANRCCVPGSKGASGFNWCCTDTADCNISCCTGTAVSISASTPCQNGGLGSFVATCA